MAMFTALKAFAKKEYKFQQRKSMQFALREYGDRAASGVCTGAVMMWVREKLTTTGAPWQVMQTKQFSPRVFGDVHERNAMTMLEAAGNQVRYSRRGLHQLAAYLGLDDAILNIRPAMQRGAGNLPEVQMLETLARVGEELPEGHAVVIEVAVGGGAQGGGHAIGMYRSRGRHLHFFDPNVGVYLVHDVLGFMQAWMDGCRYGRGWTLSPFRTGFDWVHFYTR
jgi:hypothetical protein